MDANLETNIVALTPADMVPAQAALAGWCARKLQSLRDELDDLALHEKLAVENGWKTSVVTAAIRRTKGKIVYYTKMQTAVGAGYLLVPNMPVNVVAGRAARAKQPEKVRSDIWDNFTAAQPQATLPPDGRRATFFLAWWVDTRSL